VRNDRGWSRKFEEPIPLPNGKPLVTLRDAANYITQLSKAEHQAEEWQAAMQALLLVVEQNGPPMFARIDVMRALNRHVERVFNSDRKETHWGKRILKRDQ
jgi:cob(I)alamin adenosyltransferase